MKIAPIAASALLALAVSGLTISGAQAAPLFTASFESPALNTPGIQYGPDKSSYNTNAMGPVVIPNFTFTGFSGIYKNTSLGVFNDTSFGTQTAFLQSYTESNGSTTGGAISWAISGLTVGKSYTLSFYDEASVMVPVEPFTVTAFGNGPVAFVPTTTFTLESFNFIALTSSGTIDFVGPAIPGNFASAIDNIQISAVPEPLTLSLFGAGLAGAATLRRRKRSKKT